MKIKASITLDSDVLNQIDKNVDKTHNRSNFIEKAVIFYLQYNEKLKRDLKDSSIINKNFQKLNHEAEDVLKYQDW